MAVSCLISSASIDYFTISAIIDGHGYRNCRVLVFATRVSVKDSVYIDIRIFAVQGLPDLDVFVDFLTQIAVLPPILSTQLGNIL